MTRMTFFCLAAVAMFATACERHPASELAGEQTAGPQTPADVPTNPAGAGPVSTEEKHGAPSGQKNSEQKAAAPDATPAAKGSSFFPSNK